MADYLTRRAGIWHFVRRVPDVFTELDRRGIVKQSTKVRIADDPRGVRAGKIADRMNAELEAYWRGLIEGKAQEARTRYDAARRRARAMGFEYLPAAELAQQPVADILGRLERLVAKGELEDETAVAAALGGEAPPQIMLSELFAAYESAERASITDFSPDQLRKWRNPKRRALANLIAVVGDKPIAKLTRGDALDFQSWWQDRVVDEEIEIETANKDIGHINKMLRTVDQRLRIGLNPVFSELRISGGREGQRTAFEPEFVQKRILKAGALAELNDQARAVVYLMAETGLRPSEAVNLTAKTIHLKTKVPHVVVLAEGRRMKTEDSAREIPLVGVALKVMRKHPSGFPRYRDRASSLSALVNKALGVRKLRPTEGHSLYSLRHTFEDRLTAVEAPEKVIASLMGHKWIRPKYGKGPSLEQKQRWLQRIAFKAPASI